MSNGSKQPKRYGFFERLSEEAIGQFEKSFRAEMQARRRARTSKLKPAVSILQACLERGSSLTYMRHLLDRKCGIAVANSTISRFIKAHPQLLNLRTLRLNPNTKGPATSKAYK